MNRAKIVFLLLVASLVIPLGLFFVKPHDPNGRLLVYCAAAMRKPVAAIADRYREKYGVKVELQFAGSGTLLGNIEASATGDLYIAADASYIEIARDRGLVVEALTVCQLTAGLVVKAGNPLGITSLADLRDRPDLRIVLANPEAASVGKFGQQVLRDAGMWEAVSAATLAMKPTVNELANDIKLGAADVAIVWDALAAQYPELEFVHVPEFDAQRKHVTIGVLASAGSATEALRFARYLTTAEGKAQFLKYGFRWEVAE